MPSNTTSSIISASQFQEYTTRWAQLLENPGTELAQAFQDGQGLLKSVNFPILAIAQLVSAVGARRIKARFMLQSSDANGAPFFAVALYATDDEGLRLSSYYVSTAPDGEALDLGLPNEEVADSLAQYWIAKWAAVSAVTPELFTVPYGEGALRGYTFELMDFLKPFKQLKSIDDQKMCVHFGLHEYYSPNLLTDSDKLTQTFGLILQITPGTGGVANRLYDVSMPCPKTC